MSTTENPDTETEFAALCRASREASEAEPVEPDTYAAAVDAYLAEASWLTVADAPFKIHARKVAASLDRQLDTKGEIQSALASTFAKVMGDLDKRRPGPPAPDPLTEGTGPHGEASIFTLVGDE